MKDKIEKISRASAEALIVSLNEILKNKPFVDGVESEQFREIAWELRKSGEWAFLVKDIKFKNEKLWCGVRLVSTDDPEFREIAEESLEFVDVKMI